MKCKTSRKETLTGPNTGKCCPGNNVRDAVFHIVILLASARGEGVLAMLGYPGMCHFPGYTLCHTIFYWEIVQISLLNV